MGEDLFQQDIKHFQTVYRRCMVNSSWLFITVYIITQFLQRIQTTSTFYSWTNDPFPMNYSFPCVFFFFFYISLMSCGVLYILESTACLRLLYVAASQILCADCSRSFFFISMLNLVYSISCQFVHCWRLWCFRTTPHVTHHASFSCCSLSVLFCFPHNACSMQCLSTFQCYLHTFLFSVAVC